MDLGVFVRLYQAQLKKNEGGSSVPTGSEMMGAACAPSGMHYPAPHNLHA